MGLLPECPHPCRQALAAKNAETGTGGELGTQCRGAQLLVAVRGVRRRDDQAGLSRFFLRASARSRLRRCTLTPKRASIASRHCEVVSSGLAALRSAHEGNDLGGDLVAILGTPPARQQTGEASRLQGALGLVEGRPGDAERRGSLADCNAVDLVAPHHLVAHLDQVLRVEEWIAGEQGVADGFGIGIEHAVLRQRFALWIPSFCLRHVPTSNRS